MICIGVGKIIIIINEGNDFIVRYQVKCKLDAASGWIVVLPIDHIRVHTINSIKNPW